MAISPSLEDRALIEELFARYAWALDTGDTDGFVACFTADAVFADIVEAAGADQIRQLVLRKYHANPTFAGRQHWIGQLLYEPADDDPGRCVVKSFGQVTVRRDVGCSVFWTGWYEDTVVKAGDIWLFEKRAARRWEGPELLAAFPETSVAWQLENPHRNDPLT